MKSIFLSASIPKPGREFYGTADPMLIHAAVRALLALALGRRHVVWGGHPSITPMVRAACEGLGVKYSRSVTLYQSRYFEKSFPADNDRFDNLVLTKAKQDIPASLLEMRTRMFESHDFESSVFIGGMNGIFDEYDLFASKHAGAKIVSVHRPGGAAAELAIKLGYDPASDLSPTDFTQLFIDQLGISTADPRIVDAPSKRTPAP
jgi:hypothetical protein